MSETFVRYTTYLELCHLLNVAPSLKVPKVEYPTTTPGWASYQARAKKMVFEDGVTYYIREAFDPMLSHGLSVVMTLKQRPDVLFVMNHRNFKQQEEEEVELTRPPSPTDWELVPHNDDKFASPL